MPFVQEVELSPDMTLSGQPDRNMLEAALLDAWAERFLPSNPHMLLHSMGLSMLANHIQLAAKDCTPPTMPRPQVRIHMREGRLFFLEQATRRDPNGSCNQAYAPPSHGFLDSVVMGQSYNGQNAGPQSFPTPPDSACPVHTLFCSDSTVYSNYCTKFTAQPHVYECVLRSSAPSSPASGRPD